MDYEKKYKEAFERARNVWRFSSDNAEIMRMEELFPELRESEGERIRKKLIHLVKKSHEQGGYALHKWEADELLAWLENQVGKDKLIRELGEYKVKYMQEILEKHIDNMNNKDDERLRNTTIAFLKDFADKGYENAVECIDWLENKKK